MMSGSESSDGDSESMSDEESLEIAHRRGCEEGDGWSHAFDVEYDNEGNITTIKHADQDLIHFFTKENWRRMGDAISQSPALEVIDLDLIGCPNELNVEAMEALFGEGRAYHCSSLRCVDLSDNQFGPGGMKALLPLLKSTPTLNRLHLCGVYLGEHGARLLADALNVTHIEDLDLTVTDIRDAGVEHILQAENSRHIARLNMQSNDIGSRGLGAVSQFLQREEIFLKEIFLDGNAIDSECADMLLMSVSGKSKLELLSLWDFSLPYDEGCDEAVLAIVPKLQELVCKSSSFEAVCQSNHSLKDMGAATEKILKSNPDLEKAFDINAQSRFGVSVAKRVRCKLRSFFFRGKFDVQHFLDMDIELMPHVLELVTRTGVSIKEAKNCLDSGKEVYLSRGKHYEVKSDNLDGTYRLIRNCHLPELFGFPSTIAALKADVATLRERVAELEAENAELRADITAHPNKRRKTRS